MEHVFHCHFYFLLSLLLIIAFDIELNPGPQHAIADLSVTHLNIRSIRNKLNYIKDNFLDFNILCFTETHFDNQVSTSDLFLSNSFDEPYRKDRTNHGGGLLLYPNAELVYTRRPDLEIYCEESLWVEITVRHEIFLLGLFYSPKTADSTFFKTSISTLKKHTTFRIT